MLLSSPKARLIMVNSWQIQYILSHNIGNLIGLDVLSVRKGCMFIIVKIFCHICKILWKLSKGWYFSPLKDKSQGNQTKTGSSYLISFCFYACFTLRYCDGNESDCAISLGLQNIWKIEIHTLLSLKSDEYTEFVIWLNLNEIIIPQHFWGVQGISRIKIPSSTLFRTYNVLGKYEFLLKIDVKLPIHEDPRSHRWHY